MASRAPLALLGLLVLLCAAVSAPAGADLVCPECGLEHETHITASLLVELVIGTILRHGVAILLGGAALVVGVPWAVAGIAIAAVDRATSRR